MSVVGTWIAVEDGLPDLNEYVLVFPKRGIGVRTETLEALNAKILGNEDAGWHWETDGEGFDIKTVTHWARILAPLS